MGRTDAHFRCRKQHFNLLGRPTICSPVARRCLGGEGQWIPLVALSLSHGATGWAQLWPAGWRSSRRSPPARSSNLGTDHLASFYKNFKTGRSLLSSHAAMPAPSAAGIRDQAITHSNMSHLINITVAMDRWI